MSAPTIATLRDLGRNPGLRQVLVDHARRGIRVQAVVRLCLAVLSVIAVLVLPTADRPACIAIASGYLAWSIVVAVLLRHNGERAVRFSWLTLLMDLLVITAVTDLSGASAASWSADVLVYGFFLLPLLASTQLRPWVCVAVCAPTVVAYFVVAAVGRVPNGNEPWASITLRTLVLAAASAACVLLSRLQRSRVITVGRLAADRAELVDRLVHTEERERQELAEHLHDGALQYILAARMDLEDLDGTADPDTLRRLDTALRESAQLLRSTVSELHPAVLASAGLVPALRDLARTVGDRSGLQIEVDGGDWPIDARTSADGLLFATARELLGNVMKHAQAHHVRLVLGWHGASADLTVTDDGRGTSVAEVSGKLAQGHIGLSSRRARLEAAGGRLLLSSAPGSGTVVTVTVPAAELDQSTDRWR